MKGRWGDTASLFTLPAQQAQQWVVWKVVRSCIRTSLSSAPVHRTLSPVNGMNCSQEEEEEEGREDGEGHIYAHTPYLDREYVPSVAGVHACHRLPLQWTPDVHVQVIRPRCKQTVGARSTGYCG